ncbi:MAG: Gmad2 immunoglobulin-like domain-containing protein, partial [Psychrosphaera sp.]|nr:Gmad2 immunoglobulin-like domain-containing protein [Psychrosphaera sp.]
LVVPQVSAISQTIPGSWCAPFEGNVYYYEIIDKLGNVLAEGAPTDFANTYQELKTVDLPGLLSGTEYCYTVRAYLDNVSNSYKYADNYDWLDSYHCGLVPEITPEWPANTPMTVNYSAGSAGIDINWPSVRNADYYEIQTNENSLWGDAVNVGSNLEQAFQSLFPGDYIYRVRACNEMGCSPYVSTITVSVSAPVDYCPIPQ